MVSGSIFFEKNGNSAKCKQCSTILKRTITEITTSVVVGSYVWPCSELNAYHADRATFYYN